MAKHHVRRRADPKFGNGADALKRVHLPINSEGEEIAEQAGIWRQEYKSKGQSLGTPDTVIAATAYLSDFLLVTNNVKDYPMPELKLLRVP